MRIELNKASEYLIADAKLHGALTKAGTPYRVDPGKLEAALNAASPELLVENERQRSALEQIQTILRREEWEAGDLEEINRIIIHAGFPTEQN